MPQNNDDIIRLRHMLDFARKAVAFNKGKIRADLDNNEMLALATIQAIEIIGEAASNISEELRNHYPKNRWELIIGTRNRLSHGYIEVDLDVIWTIASKDLPPLIGQLEKLIAEETGHAGA